MGARVAPQRCPILPCGKAQLVYHKYLFDWNTKTQIVLDIGYTLLNTQFLAFLRLWVGQWRAPPKAI